MNPDSEIIKNPPALVAFAPEVCNEPNRLRRTFTAETARPGDGLDAFAWLNERAGFHWFKPDTRRYFRSRIGRYFGNGVFITSEKSPWDSRRYSVRVFCADHQVETFGFFNEMSRAEALKAARRLSKLLGQGFSVIDPDGQTFHPPARPTSVY